MLIFLQPLTDFSQIAIQYIFQMTLATADTFGYNQFVLCQYLSLKIYINYALREIFGLLKLVLFVN